MIEAHERSLDDLRRFSALARHPEVTAVIRRAISLAQSHLDRARAIEVRRSSAPAKARPPFRAA